MISNNGDANRGGFFLVYVSNSDLHNDSLRDDGLCDDGIFSAWWWPLRR